MLPLLCSLLPILLLPRPTLSATLLVDGVSQWQNPSVLVGDSIIFKHRLGFNLYIFHNQQDFHVCNLTRAILLTSPTSTSYTWHPSRPGSFYFAFKNASSDSCDHQYAIVVVSPPPPPSLSPIPAPGAVPASPAYPWPFHPREAASSPAPVPTAVTVTVPKSVLGKGRSMPFINSNPAVPLPTGEIDSASIRPFAKSGSAPHHLVSVGLLVRLHVTLLCAALPLL